MMADLPAINKILPSFRNRKHCLMLYIARASSCFKKLSRALRNFFFLLFAKQAKSIFWRETVANLIYREIYAKRSATAEWEGRRRQLLWHWRNGIKEKRMFRTWWDWRKCIIVSKRGQKDGNEGLTVSRMHKCWDDGWARHRNVWADEAHISSEARSSSQVVGDHGAFSGCIFGLRCRNWKDGLEYWIGKKGLAVYKQQVGRVDESVLRTLI